MADVLFSRCEIGQCEVKSSDKIGRHAIAKGSIKRGEIITKESGLVMFTQPNMLRGREISSICRQNKVSDGFFLPVITTQWEKTTAEQRKLMITEFHCPDLHEPFLRVCTSITKLSWVKKHVPEWSARNWCEYLHIVDLNIHKDKENSPNEGGIFLLGSKFTHSCRPNSHWMFDNAGHLIYLANKDIKDGESLTFCYVGEGIDLLEGRLSRQKKLSKLQFLCQCERCSGPDHSRAMNCPSCNSDQLLPIYTEPKANDEVLPGGEHVLLDAKLWRCGVCNSEHVLSMEQRLYERRLAETVTAGFGDSKENLDLDRLQLDAGEKLGPSHWLYHAISFLRLARFARSLDSDNMTTLSASTAKQLSSNLLNYIQKHIPGTAPQLRSLFTSVRIGLDLGWDKEVREWSQEGRHLAKLHPNTIGPASAMFDAAIGS